MESFSIRPDTDLNDDSYILKSMLTGDRLDLVRDDHFCAGPHGARGMGPNLDLSNRLHVDIRKLLLPQ